MINEIKERRRKSSELLHLLYQKTVGNNNRQGRILISELASELGLYPSVDKDSLTREEKDKLFETGKEAEQIVLALYEDDLIRVFGEPNPYYGGQAAITKEGIAEVETPFVEDEYELPEIERALTNLPVQDELLETPFLAEADVSNARKMAELYVVLHCYENSVRRLIEQVLSDELGDDWWEEVANAQMKRNVEDRKKQEEKRRWLSPRGHTSPLYYLDWGDLVKLIRKHVEPFLPFIGELRFVENRFEDLESLRNIVAHHGVLPSEDDFQRVEISFRDWCRQVGNSEN